jgi:hypothetical protein
MSKGRFSFANLTGGAKSESADKAEDEGDTEAMDDEEDTSAENGEAMDDKDEEASFDAGRAAERKRIGSILSSKSVNADNMAQAIEVACNTDLSPEQAAAILAAAPVASKSSLSQRMDDEPDPHLSSGGGDDGKMMSIADRARARHAA